MRNFTVTNSIFRANKKSVGRLDTLLRSFSPLLPPPPPPPHIFFFYFRRHQQLVRSCWNEGPFTTLFQPTTRLDSTRLDLSVKKTFFLLLSQTLTRPIRLCSLLSGGSISFTHCHRRLSFQCLLFFLQTSFWPFSTALLLHYSSFLLVKMEAALGCASCC